MIDDPFDYLNDPIKVEVRVEAAGSLGAGIKTRCELVVTTGRGDVVVQRELPHLSAEQLLAGAIEGELSRAADETILEACAHPVVVAFNRFAAQHFEIDANRETRHATNGSIALRKRIVQLLEQEDSYRLSDVTIVRERTPGTHRFLVTDTHGVPGHRHRTEYSATLAAGQLLAILGRRYFPAGWPPWVILQLWVLEHEATP